GLHPAGRRARRPDVLPGPRPQLEPHRPQRPLLRLRLVGTLARSVLEWTAVLDLYVELRRIAEALEPVVSPTPEASPCRSTRQPRGIAQLQDPRRPTVRLQPDRHLRARSHHRAPDPSPLGLGASAPGVQACGLFQPPRLAGRRLPPDPGAALPGAPGLLQPLP